MLEKTIIRTISIYSDDLYKINEFLNKVIIEGDREVVLPIPVVETCVRKQDAHSKGFGCCLMENGRYVSYRRDNKKFWGYTLVGGEPKDLWCLNFSKLGVEYYNFVNDKKTPFWSLFGDIVNLEEKINVGVNIVYQDTVNGAKLTDCFLKELHEMFQKDWMRINAIPWHNNPNLYKFTETSIIRLYIQYPGMTKKLVLQLFDEPAGEFKNVFDPRHLKCTLTVLDNTITIESSEIFEEHFPGLISKIETLLNPNTF